MMVKGQALYLKGIDLDEMKSQMCDRCKVTNILLAEGEAEELCEACPLNKLELLGKLKITMGGGGSGETGKG